MAIKIDLNIPNIEKKINNDNFGTFVAHEWKRLIDPYTPRDTGSLMSTVAISPFSITYNVPYASRVYSGSGMNFRNDKNPYATARWDKAAEQAGQKDKLYRAVNGTLK